VKTALVHDWLNGMRGGEKVLEQMCQMYPDARIHTLIYEPDRVSDSIRRMPVQSSFIQKLPKAHEKYRWYLPLFPSAVKRFNLAGFDLVLSSSHCVALGARADKKAVHVCYCHTPMRYAYEYFDDYFPPGSFNSLVRGIIRLNMARMRRWDRRASRGVDAFVANSLCVAERIRRIYGRNARVVHPPVDTDFYTPSGTKEDFLLVVSALVPYKRLDIAVEAANKAGEQLVVIGEGPERKRLESLAGPTVKFLGWVDQETVRDHYRRARAFLFPGEEDFGITPLEAAACGTPVVAYARGGALETVVEGITGVFFREQSADSLVAALKRIRDGKWEQGALRKRALQFSPEKFRAGLASAIAEAAAGKGRMNAQL